MAEPSNPDADPAEPRSPGVFIVVFLGLFLLGGLPMVVAVWWGDAQHEAYRQARETRALRSLGSGLSELGLQYLEDRRRMLSLIKIGVEREEHWTAAHLQASFDAELAASPSFSELYLVREDGSPIVYSSAAGDQPRPGPSVRETDFWQKHKETQSIAWSGVQEGLTTKLPLVVVAMPVRSTVTGDAGVLVGGIQLKGLARVLQHVDSDEPLRVVVVDHTGEVAVDTSGRLRHDPLTPTQHPFASDCPDPAPRLTDEFGAELRFACKPMRVGSEMWAVWVMAPRQAADARHDNTRWQLLGSVLVALLLVGGVALFLAGRARGYFYRLNRMVEDLGSGEFNLTLVTSTRSTPRELRAFRNAARRMTGRLRDTDRQTQRLLKELEEANGRLRPLAAAWAQIGEAVEILDAEGRILFANPACVEALGPDATETGRVSTIWDGDRGVRISDSFKRRKRWTGEVHVEGPMGRRIQAVAASPVFDDDQLERIVVIRWDLTDLRTAESMAAHSERLANLGTLAAGLAHEINNPLTYVTMHLETLQDAVRRSRKPDLVVAAREAREGVSIIQKVVQEILLIARGRDQSGLGEAREAVSIRSLVDSAITLARGRIRGRATVDLQVEGDPRVRVRVTELTQVFVNLLVNAGLAYPESHQQGVVQVRAFVEGDDDPVVAIEVRDKGEGMTVDQLRQAFDPFFTTRRVGEGTGLGLPLARSIVDAHGGTLSAQSAKGVGSVFTVRLPAETGDVTYTGPMLRLVPARRLRVLVVDDDRRVAQVVARSLSDHDVTIAIGGFEALERLDAGGFDVVLSDVMMPDLDGPGLYEEVALHWPDLAERFAFITGAPRGSAVTRAVKEAGRPVFHKPVQGRVIEAWLATLELP